MLILMTIEHSPTLACVGHQMKSTMIPIDTNENLLLNAPWIALDSHYSCTSLPDLKVPPKFTLFSSLWHPNIHISFTYLDNFCLSSWRRIVNRWGKNHSQLCPQILKEFYEKGLGEYINYLFLCWYIFQPYNLINHLFSNKVILYVYMFGFWVKNGILGYTYKTCVIIYDGNGFIICYLHVLQFLLHPQNQSATRCNFYVIGLSSRKWERILCFSQPCHQGIS